MELSVIIVNYNVKHFLEQCLHSVIKASGNIESEIFVVDNNSVDGSAQLIHDKFPDVHFIDNKVNVGFSKANNQAIRESRGRYILLLNPDTVVEENTFTRVLEFMDKHPEAGGVGVKMIDGKGNFLPESKRGLPTPWVAFCKMFGLAALFPRSKKFGQYHLSYLNENETHEVDVLAGAFMMLRKKVLDKTGLLDEDFFMYGEDIDLSYRITQAGYRNYYFPETTIIHYKGESTKKGSLNYVKVFYSAMIIFARKHFSSGKAGTFTFLLHLAIWFRALLSVLRQVFSRIIIPLTDAIVIYAGFLILTPLWESYRYEPGYYPPFFLQTVVPAYILIWIFSVFFSGGYKKPVNLMLVLRGIIYGMVAILLIYSLVDEQYRFSRALILLGTFWAGFALLLYRLSLHWLKLKSFRLDIKRTKRIAIAGHITEATRVRDILRQTRIQSEFAGFIAVDSVIESDEQLGSINSLNEIVRINRIDEIIFCAENIPSADIIHAMLELSALNVDFKIAPPESISIIGSNSIHTAGDLYVIQLNSITKPVNRRKKRSFDVIACLIILLLSPFIIWFFKEKQVFFNNILQVIKGNKTWIGYHGPMNQNAELPPIKPGILTPADMFSTEAQLFDNSGSNLRLNVLYARNYSILTDTGILLKGWQKLDRQRVRFE